ncbi:MAG: type II secretion system protein GspJ [Candidatus Methylomirabilia bacterium]
MSNQRGLTLLEVLIALALVGLVGVIAVLSLRLVSHAWERGEAALDTTQRARFVTDLMTRELRSALPYLVRLSKDEQAVAFSGMPSSVRFMTVTRGLAAAVPEGGLREVTYAFGSGGLYRIEAPASDRHFFEPGRGVSVLLESGVKEFSLQYLDRASGTWQESWPSTVINLKEEKDEETDPADFFPGAVAVELTLLNEEGMEERLPPLVILIPSQFPPKPKAKGKAGGTKPVGKGKAKGKAS